MEQIHILLSNKLYMLCEKAAKFHTGTANVERSVENLIQSDQCCSLLHSIKPKDSVNFQYDRKEPQIRCCYDVCTARP